MEIRKEIANRFTKTSHAPTGLIEKFSSDDIGVAELTGLGFETACRVWEPEKTEAVAIACKASDLPRDLFSTLVVLMCKDGSKDISDIQSLRQVYEGIPKFVAERTLRFWKMRKHAQTTDAA